jgi:hypothetical protein
VRAFIDYFSPLSQPLVPSAFFFSLSLAVAVQSFGLEGDEKSTVLASALYNVDEFVHVDRQVSVLCNS